MRVARSARVMLALHTLLFAHPHPLVAAKHPEPRHDFGGARVHDRHRLAPLLPPVDLLVKASVLEYRVLHAAPRVVVAHESKADLKPLLLHFRPVAKSTVRLAIDLVHDAVPSRHLLLAVFAIERERLRHKLVL